MTRPQETPSYDRFKSVTLLSSGTPVAETTFTYYPSSDSNGVAGDLEAVANYLDYDAGAGTFVDPNPATYYFRYYTAYGSTTGDVNDLELVLTPQDFADAGGQITTVDGLNPSQIAPYATFSFTYVNDSDVTANAGQVASEATYGGTATYSFSVSQNTDVNSDVNDWTAEGDRDPPRHHRGNRLRQLLGPSAADRRLPAGRLPRPSSAGDWVTYNQYSPDAR